MRRHSRTGLPRRPEFSDTATGLGVVARIPAPIETSRTPAGPVWIARPVGRHVGFAPPEADAERGVGATRTPPLVVTSASRRTGQ